MTISVTAVIIIVAALAIIGYLLYSQTQNNGIKLKDYEKFQNAGNNNNPTQRLSEPGIGHMNIAIDTNNDPYSDAIKKQDLYGMMDPLTYPQMRLSREVLEKYQQYYEEHGEYPNFAQFHKPMFDNPIHNGHLIKLTDPDDPFTDNVPMTVPLFRVKSMKNTNRFYYYIIDSRNNSKIDTKIPLEAVTVNGRKYTNGEFYGLPELYDDDVIENVIVFPGTKFKVFLYKNFSYP